MASPDQYYNFTRIREGGLSRNPDDHAASDPAPCSYNGKTGWHTNKGITWSTFKFYAPVLGYSPSCDLFFNMPNQLWQDIFSQIWKGAGAYDIKNPALANLVFQWRWGSGPASAVSHLSSELKAYSGVSPGNFAAIAQTINSLSDTPEKARKLFDFLWNERLKFYYALNQPTFIKGWVDGWNKFRDFNEKYLNGSPVPGSAQSPQDIEQVSFWRRNRKKILIGTGVAAAATTLLIFGIRRKRKRRRRK